MQGRGIGLVVVVVLVVVCGVAVCEGGEEGGGVLLVERLSHQLSESVDCESVAAVVVHELVLLNEEKEEKVKELQRRLEEEEEEGGGGGGGGERERVVREERDALLREKEEGEREAEQLEREIEELKKKQLESHKATKGLVLEKRGECQGVLEKIRECSLRALGLKEEADVLDGKLGTCENETNKGETLEKLEEDLKKKQTKEAEQKEDKRKAESERDWLEQVLMVLEKECGEKRREAQGEVIQREIKPLERMEGEKGLGMYGLWENMALLVHCSVSVGAALGEHPSIVNEEPKDGLREAIRRIGDAFVCRDKPQDETENPKGLCFFPTVPKNGQVLPQPVYPIDFYDEAKAANSEYPICDESKSHNYQLPYRSVSSVEDGRCLPKHTFLGERCLSSESNAVFLFETRSRTIESVYAGCEDEQKKFKSSDNAEKTSINTKQELADFFVYYASQIFKQKPKTVNEYRSLLLANPQDGSVTNNCLIAMFNCVFGQPTS
eukprot:Nk52_evm1s2106 gene=Nk52_evmTU1s2106